MAEKNDFTHLPLPLLFQGKPKLRGGGAVSARQRGILPIELLMVAM